INERARRSHRFGLGRTDDRARRARRDLYAHRRRTRHRSRAHAPRGGDRRGHARQPPAQWRSRDAASHLRINPWQELPGYSHGGDRQRAYRPRGGHRTGFGIGIVLNRWSATEVVDHGLGAAWASSMNCLRTTPETENFFPDSATESVQATFPIRIV